MILSKEQRIHVPPEKGKENFLDIMIRERKAEKKPEAEAKRKADLQRIENRKSTSGVDPSQRFPKQVWNKIFDDLDPEDRDNVWQIHPLFRTLMKTNRIRDNLLPQVLKIEAFQYYLYENPYRRDYHQLVQLRLISKATRDSIDQWFEGNLLEELHDNHQISKFTLTDHDYCANFRIGESEDRRKLTKLLTGFKDTNNPAKRFFLRGISVSFSESESRGKWIDQSFPELRNQFKKDITALLQLIGDQIWHFRFFMIELNSTGFSFPEVYTLFRLWITLMPNLKWLEFCVEDTDRTPEAVKKNLLKNHPIPRLASMERLSLHFHIKYPPLEIYEAVIVSCSQATILEFTDNQCCGAMLPYLPVQPIKSMNLKSIFMSNYDWRGLSMRWIDPIVNINWPLKAIMLELNMCGAKIENFFRFLAKFPTLEHVQLMPLQNVRIANTDSCGYLQLPNLKCFELRLQDDVVIDYRSNIHFFFSLQFLLRCKNLKDIHWVFSDVQDKKLRNHLKQHERGGETVDFRAGLRFLYDSNIWDVFSYLESVSVFIQKTRGLEEDYFAPTCKHSYRRDEKVSIAEFKKSHLCCVEEDGLKSCVVLVE